MASSSKRDSKPFTAKPDFRALLAHAAEESISLRRDGGKIPPQNDDDSFKETESPQVGSFIPFIPSESMHSQTLRRDNRNVSSVHASNNDDHQEEIHRPANRDRLRISADCENTTMLERPQDEDPLATKLVSEADPASARASPSFVFNCLASQYLAEFEETEHPSSHYLDMARSKAFQDALKIDRNHSSGHECTKHHTELEIPEVFRSVCICDPKLIGDPILLKSRYWQLGPRGLKVGACEFANLGNALRKRNPQKDSRRDDSEKDCPEEALEEQDYCLLGSQTDVRMNPQFHLECGDWLVSAESGIAKCILIDRMDVTCTIRCLSILFSGPGPDDWHDECIDWFESDVTHGLLPARVNLQRPEEKASPLAASPFSEFIDHIACLHRCCFVLAPSHNLGRIPSNQKYEHWQITHMTPYLYSRTADRLAGLSHTSEENLKHIGTELSAGLPTSFQVKWGLHGRLQRLYCTPMQAGTFIGCWLCFLVEPAMRDLWGDLERHPLLSRAVNFQTPAELHGTSVD